MGTLIILYFKVYKVIKTLNKSNVYPQAIDLNGRDQSPKRVAKLIFGLDSCATSGLAGELTSDLGGLLMD